ncbi:MAG TPA: hypothetical protein DHU80_01145, partial [Cryomorphaceae bacterium]|nr:hypothetical protein [Cryomorphaceae bacterium]
MNLLSNHLKHTSTLPLHFTHLFTDELPADIETDNHRRTVTAACFSYVKPKTVKAPKLVAYSKEVAMDLGLSDADCESD